MEPQHTCALLIGSGKCYLDGGTVKKGGIRRTRDKKGDWLPEGIWADGDIGEMKYLLRKVKRVRKEDVVECNYQEHDEISGKCADGKIDVLQKISELFDRDDKTFFVLYYTGHGLKDDGSWVFPVQRTMAEDGQNSTPGTDTVSNVNPPPESSTEREPASGESLAANEVTVHADVHTEREPASGESPAGNIVTVHADVHTVPGATEGASYNGVEEQEEVIRYESLAEAVPKIKDGSEIVESLKEGGSIVVSQYVHRLASNPVPLTKKSNDFVTFEDVIGLWDEKKNGRNRYLMIILDCCYAGKWVENMNRKNRRDICIQAACRSIEICKVAKDQLTSVFTKAFVSAQCLSLGKKVALSFLDHAFVLNFVSIARSDEFTPLSSQYAPFGDIKFFDSFDDMYLKTTS